MFDDIGKGLSIVFALAAVGVVLGIWKLVDIIIWIVNHVRIV